MLALELAVVQLIELKLAACLWSLLCLLIAFPAVLEEVLVSIENELQAVEMQIQELVDKQQELLQKKMRVKNLIKQSSGDLEAGGSKDTESSAEEWNRIGMQSQILIF